MIAVAVLMFAASVALLGWSTRRQIAANPTTRIRWWSDLGLTRPRWNRTLRSAGTALLLLGAQIFGNELYWLWIFPVATLVAIAVMVVPVIDHNGRITYGDRW